MPIKIELRNKPPTRRKEKKAEKKKAETKLRKDAAEELNRMKRISDFIKGVPKKGIPSSKTPFKPKKNPIKSKKGAAGGPIPKSKPKKAPPGTQIGPGRKEKKGVPHGVDDGTIFLKKGGSVGGSKVKRKAPQASLRPKSRPKRPAKTRYSTDIVDDDLKNIPKFLEGIEKRGRILAGKIKKDRMPIYRKEGGSASKFGMLSVKAGVDNNPNPTQADRIVGATKKMRRGGKVTGRGIGPAGASIVSEDGKRIKNLSKAAKSLAAAGARGLQKAAGQLASRPKVKSIGAVGAAAGLKKAAGQLAGRLAKRGYGKARK